MQFSQDLMMKFNNSFIPLPYKCTGGIFNHNYIFWTCFGIKRGKFDTFCCTHLKKNSDEDNFRSHMGDNVDNSTDSDIIKFLLPRPPSIPSKGNRGIENQQQFCFCQPNDWQLIEHYPFNAGISLILFLADFSSPIPSPTVSGWIWHYLAIYWHFLAIL